MGNRISDGKAPAFPFPSGQVINDFDLYRVNGWTGAVIGNIDGTQTDRTRAMEMDTNAIYSVLLPSGLTPAVGDYLSWTTGSGFKRGDTHLVAAATAGSVGPVCKVLVAKNAAGYAQVRLLQSANPGGGGQIVEQASIVSLTDNGGGAAADDTIAIIRAPTDTPATADALRDNLEATTLADIRDAIKELSTKVNTILSTLDSAGITA